MTAPETEPAETAYPAGTAGLSGTAEAATLAVTATPGEDAVKSPWNDPRMPWNGKPRRVDILCWAAIMLSGVYYFALIPFRAELVGTHPVLGEVLNGGTESIISAAAFARVGHGTLLVVILAAIPGLMKFHIIYWWAGRLWGERVIHLMSGKRERSVKYMARVERWGRRFTWPAMIVWPFVPLPAVIYLIAGWAGMWWTTFLVLDLIGTLLWVGMLAGLGYAIGQPAVHVAQTISHYSLWITIGLVVVIVFFTVRSQRRLVAGAAQAERAGQAE